MATDHSHHGADHLPGRAEPRSPRHTARRARFRADRRHPVPPTLRAVDPDLELLTRARAGDEAAFVTLVHKYHGSMVRVARTYAPTDSVAEEAAQDAWLGVVRGIERFEGRSSFKTWLFRILVNRARTAGEREPRHIDLPGEEPAVDASRFAPGGAWADPLPAWEEAADDRLVSGTWAASLRLALGALPPRQREVVLLRDVEGLTSAEVCEVLGISEGNQRVLLHRGRSRLRSLLEVELTARGR